MIHSFHPEEPRHVSGHALSYYAATAKGLVVRPAFEGTRKVSVCVIGGGFTGLSAALTLAEHGADVVLLEAGRIGSGASGRNGGQIWRGQRANQKELEAVAGNDTARALWDLAEEAVALIHSRISQYDIDCDYRPGALAAAANPDHLTWLRDEYAHRTDQYGDDKLALVEPEEMDAYVTGGNYHGGLWDKGSGHFHPLNYALGLAHAAERAGAQIFENSKVGSWRENGRYVIETERGTIEADALIVAGNLYSPALSGPGANTVLPITSFVGASEPLPANLAASLIPCGGCVADTRMVLDYYRMARDNRLIIGGREAYGPRFPSNMPDLIHERMVKVFPQLADYRIEYGWGGWVGITWRRFPHFARLGKQAYMAQGFSGHGVALSGLAGKLMAEAALGAPERFEVFTRIKPRPFPGGRHLRRPLTALAMAFAGLKDWFS